MPADPTPNRLDTCFERLRVNGKRAFVAYICAGDPDLPKTVELVLALERAGVDVVELGLPFSDPLADGVVNQMAAERALKAGATTAGVLKTIADIRAQSPIPLVLFTYLNPVYTYGYEAFHRDAAKAGADGVLILDLPPDEARLNAELAPDDRLRHIQLIAPTSSEQRIAAIASQAQGFIYYVSRLGVTGEQVEVASGIGEQVAGIRRHSNLPVCVGFGVSTPQQAATIAAMADGVVVGSAIVKCIEANGSQTDLADRLEQFVRPLVQAVKDLA